MPEKKCTWKFDPSDGYYEASCGYAFYFDDASRLDPCEPEFKFCPYCGLQIKEVGYAKV